jgi:transcriptional regulator with XRE-family HTH domain
MGKKRWSKEQKVLQDLLREIRLQAGLKQTELARLLGHSQNYVSKIELGEKRMDLHELNDFCEACGTTLLSVVRIYVRRLSRK